MSLRDLIRRTPGIGPAARAVRRLPWTLRHLYRRRSFGGSRAHWEQTYARGGTSGSGSYGRLAEFKAEVLNTFVAEQGIESVVELGCGDGHQLSLARYPRYLGLDVAEGAIARCRERFAGDPTRRFLLYRPDELAPDAGLRAQLAVSLDVIFHLVEDQVFERYMRDLFRLAERWVAIYSSNTDENPRVHAPHVRHRRFTDWVEANEPGWALVRHVPNRYPFRGDARTGSYSDFFIFERRSSGEAASRGEG